MIHRDNAVAHYHPRYIEIAKNLGKQIKDGILQPDDSLPSYRKMAIDYGVSVVTISHAIKYLDSLGRITRRRGRAVQIVSPQRTHSPTKTVGLIVPDITSPYFASLAKIIQLDFQAVSNTVLTLSSDGNKFNLHRCLRKLIEWKVDGIILIPLEINQPEQEESLWTLKIEKIPFVYLDDAYHRVPSDFVILDIEQGIRYMAKHLVSLGHRKIACISAQPFLEITSIKINAFVRCLQQRQISIRDSWIVVSDKRLDEGGYEAALRILSQTEHPTSIFATNDLIAVGVIRAANTLGLRVPQDLSVAGFDDIPIARALDPPLTTMAQPIEELAHTAAGILLNRIQEKLPSEFQQVIFPLKLMSRESTAPFQAR